MAFFGVVRTSFREWFYPIIRLSDNWISLIGVVLITTAVVMWLFLLPVMIGGVVDNPYLGILAFLLLPVAFFTGLVLIPLGGAIRRRQALRERVQPMRVITFDLHNKSFRRLLEFFLITTVVNLAVGSQLIYRAVTYMDTVTFCGKTCHTVMQPEFTAYQNSPHSRVECVQCHIGPGASWFVQSKLSGVHQVFAVLFHTYPRPIPVPVESLRPARQTCEECHWPQRFTTDRLRILPSYAEDEQNTRTDTVLLMRLGGGPVGPSSHVGIHGAHLGPGIVIRYAPSDESRQTIPWVEHTNTITGKTIVFQASGTTPAAIRKLPVRVMDCMDCHNRPTHTFDMPDRALNDAMAAGMVSPILPFVKKTGLEILRKPYASREQAATTIPAAFAAFYQKNYPAIYSAHGPAIADSAHALLGIYDRNVFPVMKVTWGTYPNNIGHTDSPGCFRCHDGDHTSANGQTVPNDCTTCHQLLAVDEKSPKILSDLGITTGAAR